MNHNVPPLHFTFSHTPYNVNNRTAEQTGCKLRDENTDLVVVNQRGEKGGLHGLKPRSHPPYPTIFFDKGLASRQEDTGPTKASNADLVFQSCGTFLNALTGQQPHANLFLKDLFSLP